MGAQAVRLSNIDIDKALEQRHFELLFQPIFDLSNGALARIETFVRWRHETLGLLPPGAFISFFETQGRMSELTRYVLEQTLDNYLAWRGPYQPGFSINLALSDLTDESFVSHFAVLLREKNFPAELVTLECPMPPVTMERSTAIASFERLAGTGARLAIEIRGRANDFVRTLEPFPFAEIKTGGAAILRFARTVRGPGLSAISELLDLAKERNAAITAVGVEDQASLTALRGLNFDAAQGNHLGRVGLLKDFKLSMVNDVRSNLDLDVLSKTELDSLFRTHLPDATSTEEIKSGDEDTKATKKETKAKRPKRKQTKEPAKALEPEVVEETPPSEEDLLDRLEERLSTKGNHFKAIEEDRKAAAIRRARMKKATLETSEEVAAPKEEALQPSAHELQERLSQEYSEQDGTADEETAKTDETDAIVEDNIADDFDTSTEDVDGTKAKSKVAEEATPDLQADLSEGSVPEEEKEEAATTSNSSKPVAPPQEKASAMTEESKKESDEITASTEEPVAKSHEETDVETVDAADTANTPEIETAQEEAPKAMPPQQARPSLIELGGLSVRNAHAFFRPGVRVAGPESMSLDELYADFKNNQPPQQTPSAPALNQAQQESETAQEAEQAELSVEDASDLTREDDVVVEFADAAPASDAVPEIDQDDTEDVQEAPLVPPAAEQDFIAAVQSLDNHRTRRPRRRGNFLTRKHRLFSGYFWPKPWRQSWARKEAEKLAAETASFDS